jgi:hypothetical protein
MPVIQVARPFVLNTGARPRYVFGVGCFDVPDPILDRIMTTPHLRVHLQDEVLARGGLLLQHRDPPVIGWAGANFHGDGLTVVANIEPQPVMIWSWPPPGVMPVFIDGSVEPAPWEVVALLVPVEGQPGHFERASRLMTRTIPSGRFDPAFPSPGVNSPLVRWPQDPRIGDVYLPGIPPGTAPIDPRQAALPAMPPRPDPVPRYQQMIRDQSLCSSRTEAALPLA